MSELGTLVLLWCTGVLLLAGTVKGVLGIGIPLISVSLLSLAIDVPLAVSLLPVPILFANLWQSLGSGYAAATLRRFWPLIAGIALGTFVGAHLLASVDPHALYAVVGAAVVIFSLTGQFEFRLRVPRRGEHWLGALVGVAGGVLGGMTTIFGPPVIMFLFALNLAKDEFVGSVSTIYLCTALPLIAALAWYRVMGMEQFLWSSAAVVPVFAGVLLGQRLRPLVSHLAFRRGLLVVLLLVGIRLLTRGLAAD